MLERKVDSKSFNVSDINAMVMKIGKFSGL
jgi:hypothetical protein